MGGVWEVLGKHEIREMEVGNKGGDIRDPFGGVVCA